MGMNERVKGELQKLRNAVSTGTSHASRVVVAAGLLIGVAMLCSGWKEPENGFLKTLFDTGHLFLNIIVPVLTVFTAYGVSNKAGIGPGAATGIVAAVYNAGFFGALGGGLAAGYLSWLLMKIPFCKRHEKLTSFVIAPIVVGIPCALMMAFVFARPAAWLNQTYTSMFNLLQEKAPWLLGALLGIICQWDFGGPVSKSIGFFCLQAVMEGNWMPEAVKVITACVPQFAFAIALTLGGQKLWTEGQLMGRKNLWSGGCFMVSEYCIPYVASDKRRMHASTVIATGAAGALCAVLGIEAYCTAAGLLATLLTTKPLCFLLCIAAGSLIGAALILLLKLSKNAMDARAERSVKNR